MERTITSLRKRYQQIVREVGPIGNSDYTAYVRLAKKCDRDIFEKAEIQIGDDSDESIMFMPNTNLKHDIDQEEDEPPLGKSQDSSPHSSKDRSSDTEALIEKVLRRIPRTVVI